MDIVERLRGANGDIDLYARALCEEAADEIERLTVEIELLRSDRARLSEELSYRVHTDEDIKVLNREIGRLRAALDKICGIALGCRDDDLPAAMVHKICCTALGEVKYAPGKYNHEGERYE